MRATTPDKFTHADQQGRQEIVHRIENFLEAMCDVECPLSASEQEDLGSIEKALQAFVNDMRERRAPNTEQRAALAAYAARYGRDWKEKLLTAWLDGRDAKEPDGYLLRQVRNRLGPSWLATFELEVA